MSLSADSTFVRAAGPERSAAARVPRGPLTETQELKFRLHRKLLDKINLDALAAIETQRVRQEVLEALFSLLDEEPALLTATEREQIAGEVLDEVFGLGPLESLLEDPTVSDILVNGAQSVYVERGGLLEPTDLRFR
ncbi:MAG TPA: hypothetical protein VG345_13650, partial [Bryobacteraceae bacterium]|nr:hypothetical protein [Bryobacteraceae bacterium]